MIRPRHSRKALGANKLIYLKFLGIQSQTESVSSVHQASGVSHTVLQRRRSGSNILSRSSPINVLLMGHGTVEEIIEEDSPFGGGSWARMGGLVCDVLQISSGIVVL